MKIGETYRCIKTYFFGFSCYFIENNTYIIKEIKTVHVPHDRILFEYNEGPDDGMFMTPVEMSEYFANVPLFKFGR